MNAFWLIHQLNQLAVTNCPLDSNAQANKSCDTTLPTVALNDATIRTLLQLFFGIIGVVAVIFILIAGFQLVTSQGDSQSMGKARQTIIYAGIGLAVALSAEAIVTLVLGKL